jgi:hypothetical protein
MGHSPHLAQIPVIRDANLSVNFTAYRNLVPKRSKVDFERRPESIPLNPSVPRPWYTPEFEIVLSQKVIIGLMAHV